MNELQTTVRWLAGKAGYEVAHCSETSYGLICDADDYHYAFGNDQGWLPGADGTLALEDVGLVLDWLAKAGYEYHGMGTRAFNGYAFDIRKRLDEDWTNAFGDTLAQALVAALLKLPKEST